MADVRSLLQKERAARRINHPQATYSTKGTLICLVCNIQLKSESLWSGHLRSSQHSMRLQKLKESQVPLSKATPEGQLEEGDSEPAPATNGTTNGSETLQRKRGREDEAEVARKKSKSGALPEGFFDEGVEAETSTPEPAQPQEIQLVSRPATPLKTPTEAELILKVPLPAVDEDEWAAFEAEIAAEEEVGDAAQIANDAVISAPAMSADELAAKAREEESAQRKERQEAEMEGDKEDAARKLEEEFEEMEELETRVKKLKEKREALRLKDTKAEPAAAAPPPETATVESVAAGDDDEDDSDEDDEDEWDGFRLR